MKRLIVWICALALALPAQADEVVGEAAPNSPSGTAETVAAGYAFDQPEVLAAQLLWGLAHGVRLLALACAEHGKRPAAEAWVDWQEREQPQILAAGRLLGRHYFATEEAPPDAIAAALGLQAALALPTETLGPACDSLRAALAQPRYDLQRFREQTLEALQQAFSPAPAEVFK